MPPQKIKQSKRIRNPSGYPGKTKRMKLGGQLMQTIRARMKKFGSLKRPSLRRR